MTVTPLDVLTIRLEGLQYDLARLIVVPHKREEADRLLAVTRGQMPETRARPVLLLGCAFCPGAERGRQWWAQERGRGTCMACAARILREKKPDDARRMIGIRGIHWGVDGDALPIA